MAVAAASSIVCATSAASGVEVGTSAARTFVATTGTTWGPRTSPCSPMCPPGFSPVRLHQGSRPMGASTRRWRLRCCRPGARCMAGYYAPCISKTFPSWIRRCSLRPQQLLKQKPARRSIGCRRSRVSRATPPRLPSSTPSNGHSGRSGTRSPRRSGSHLPGGSSCEDERGVSLAANDAGRPGVLRLVVSSQGLGMSCMGFLSLVSLLIL